MHARIRGSGRARGFLAGIFLCAALGAEAAGPLAAYPEIKALDSSDLLFSQLVDSLHVAYSDEHRPEKLAERSFDLTIYRYRVPADIDLFSLAARLNIPYDCLATLNRIPHSGPVLKGTDFLVPSRPGIFLAVEPVNDFECLMANWRASSVPDEGASGMEAGGNKGSTRPPLSARVYVRRPGSVTAFDYFPGARFVGSERLFFLNGLYRYPLPRGARVSSGFGYRVSPISGRFSMHSGIDLAANPGTDVLACRAGTVIESGWDDTLGQYVVISHGGGDESMYGHLSKRLVALRDKVKSGTIVGAVGTTGKSTGPHLHFEIRVRGEARNPESFIPRMRSDQ